MRPTRVCFAPDQCEPCRLGAHADCSWDGEPDCLCADCQPERKAANLAAFAVELDHGELDMGAISARARGDRDAERAHLDWLAAHEPHCPDTPGV